MSAQVPYPVKPIRIIVSFSAGGPQDILARLAGQHLTAAWGQQVVIENRPGGNAVIGTDLAAKSAPDGYTLTMVAVSHSAIPSLIPNLPFDIVRDFTPVIQLVSSPNLVVTHPALPVKTVNDLIALARARPGQIAFASGGTGSVTHLSAELLRQTAGVNMIHVPYKGSAPAMVDLMSGQVSWGFGTMLPTLNFVKGGKLKAIAVTGVKRTAVLPDVPIVGLPGFETGAWFGLFAPAATPGDIVTRLNRELARGLTAPEMRERLAQQGNEVVAGTPEQFGALFRSEMTKWASVVKQAGIKLE